MNIEQIYTGCLAQGAYYIESEGEVAVIDPLREVQPYIARAERNQARIKYIFETHFHADFVSGHLTLSEKTGAPIVYGPNAEPDFEALIAKDGQEFKIGKISLTALHTPGHTMESTTYLLKDENGKPHAIFTGDTLFIGDVGRPDLAQKGAELTQDDLAGYLYDSLRTRIMTLPDDVIVYPAHGAGSACGKNMSNETTDTLGNQKKFNYALRADMTREEFIKEVTEGLTPPPSYFPLNVKMNREGYESIDRVLEKGQKAFGPDEFEDIANTTGAVILDVRHQDAFVKGFIPNSIFIGLDGNFAPWVGAMVRDTNQPILLVAPENRLEEAITRLSRVGFDNILGYLKGGVEAWKKSGRELDSMRSISAEDMKKELEQNLQPVVDVRKETEYLTGHYPKAQNIVLDYMNDHMSEFPQNDFFLHCAAGYRSVIAGSILKSRGIHHLTNVEGGFKAMRDSGLEVATGNEKTKTL